MQNSVCQSEDSAGVTTIFRENAGRQHSNERHGRSTLNAFPFCPTSTGGKAGFTVTFSLVQRFYVSVHIANGSNTAKFHGGGIIQFAHPWLMVAVGWSGMISFGLKEGRIERHQILTRDATEESIESL